MSNRSSRNEKGNKKRNEKRNRNKKKSKNERGKDRLEAITVIITEARRNFHTNGEMEKYTKWFDCYQYHLIEMYNIYRSNSIDSEDNNLINRNVSFDDFCECIYESTIPVYTSYRGTHKPLIQVCLED